MGRGISLLLTIFTHQNTPNWFLLQEVPITKGGHCLLLKQETYSQFNTVYHAKKVSTYLTVTFPKWLIKNAFFSTAKKKQSTVINFHFMQSHSFGSKKSMQLSCLILPQG